MSGFVPVGKVLNATYSSSLTVDFLNGLQSAPLSDTEILSVAHHFPICIRNDGSLASVCAVVESRHTARSPIDSHGQWHGGYKPIALRCAPFRLRPDQTGNPLLDLEIFEGSLTGSSLVRDGIEVQPVCNKEGKLSHELGTCYNGLRHVQSQQKKLIAALDQLFLAGLLMPLAQERPTAMTESHAILSELRFEVLTNRALEGMARQTFAGIELATAMIFSQMHLVRDMRPAVVERLSLKHLKDETQATALMATTLDTLEPWLDESELFSLEEFEGADYLPDTFAR
jgi:SapC